MIAMSADWVVSLTFTLKVTCVVSSSYMYEGFKLEPEVDIESLSEEVRC